MHVTFIWRLTVVLKFVSMLQLTPQLPNMEFGRRLAVEKELEKTPAFQLCNACESAGSCGLY